MEGSVQNFKVQRWIAVLSVALFLVKIFAWYITRSVAILTDALESIVNVIAAFIGLYSLYVSAKPKDSDHPYGHGKVEFISSAIEGTFITVAGIIIIYEAIVNLIYPKAVHQLDYGIILVAFTALVNYVAGAICKKIGNKNKSIALTSSGAHLQSDTYTTIGIVVGLILLYFTKLWWIDSVIAIIFAFVIIVTGLKIIRSSIGGIMDEADEELLNNLVETLNKKRRINWIDLHNVRIIKYGPTLHIDCHLTVPWYFNVHEAHNEIDEMVKLVRENYGEQVEFFIHNDGCLPPSCSICFKKDCPVRQHLYQKTIDWTAENIRNNTKHNIHTS